MHYADCRALVLSARDAQSDTAVLHQGIGHEARWEAVSSSCFRVLVQPILFMPYGRARVPDSRDGLISTYFRFMELAGTGSSQANLTAEPAEAVNWCSKQGKAMGQA